MSRDTTAGAASSADVQAIRRWAALAVGSGAIAGAAIGGVGGRLAMLQLRRESPLATGLTSDDGFEIGRVTLAGSIGLVVLTGLLGAAFGVLYAIVRLGLPAPVRIPAAALVGGTVGANNSLDPDGIDLLVLDPTWFAVAAFIVLPALAAACIAFAIERGARGGRWPRPVALPAAARPAARALVTTLVAVLIAVQAAALVDLIGSIPS